MREISYKLFVKVSKTIEEKEKGELSKKQTLHSVMFEFYYKDYTGVYSKGNCDLCLHQNKIRLKQSVLTEPHLQNGKQFLQGHKYLINTYALHSCSVIL